MTWSCSPILTVMVSVNSWTKLYYQSKTKDDMKLQSNTNSYGQSQLMIKAQESVQDHRWHEVSVQHYSYGQCQFMTKVQLSVKDQALHCFSPRSDGTSTDKGSKGQHWKQTVGSTHLESTNLQHIILLPSVAGRNWSPQQHAANTDVYLWDTVTSNWKGGTSVLEHSGIQDDTCVQLTVTRDRDLSRSSSATPSDSPERNSTAKPSLSLSDLQMKTTLN